MARPTFPLRLLLGAILVLLTLGALLTLTYAADALLSILERLQRLPEALAWALGLLAAVLLLLSGWLLWTLLRPARTRKPTRAVADRPDIERRLARLPPQHQEQVRLQSELRQLDQRSADTALYVAVFGEISAGKSTLVASLCGEALASDVRGGTTRAVTLHALQLADGQRVQLADVPGTNEERGGALAVAARDEALRAHLVLYVVDGDLSRDQGAELDWLRAFGKPVVPVLNKIDRYSAAELAALSEKLARRFGERPLLVSAGGEEELTVIDADGSRRSRRRARQPQLQPLLQRLQQAARQPRAALEQARHKAVLQAVDLRLSESERSLRREQAEQTVSDYARRAMVGALAAVAPGTDLLIQGSLATLLLRRLTEIYGVRAAEVDLDGLVSAAGGKLRGGSALLLAIGGNALKAFPGLGTLGGGLVHALAYGMIFTSLGRALIDTLERHGELDRDSVLQGFGQQLDNAGALGQQARHLLPLLREAWQQRQPPAEPKP